MGGRDSKTSDEELAIAARVHALIERGLGHYAQGNVHAAMVDWEHALALDPDSERARQYLDDTNSNLETFDQMPSAAEDMDMDGLFPLASADAVSDVDPELLLAADDMLDIPSMDTLQDGWLLADLLSSDQPPVIDSFGPFGQRGQSGPEVEQMLPGNLRAVAEELLGIARRDTPRATTDWGAAPTDAADSNDRWYPEPIIDPQSAALAPTVELVLPERLADLFETGAGIGPGSARDRPDEPDEDSSSLPPPDAPPLIIEESDTGGETGAYYIYPGDSVADDRAAPEAFGNEPTVERELPRAKAGAHQASRTETLEMFPSTLAGPSPSPDPTSSLLSPVARRLLDELETHAPADPDSDESLRHRVSWLLERAESECVAGDNDAAITALDLALDEQPDSAVAQKLIHRHIDTILDIYERYLDNPAAVPAVQISPSEFREHAIDNRAAFLLSRIDGTLTVEDILDISGMPRLEACRYLCSMLRRGILTLR